MSRRHSVSDLAKSPRILAESRATPAETKLAAPLVDSGPVAFDGHLSGTELKSLAVGTADRRPDRCCPPDPFVRPGTWLLPGLGRHRIGSRLQIALAHGRSNTSSTRCGS